MTVLLSLAGVVLLIGVIVAVKRRNKGVAKAEVEVEADRLVTEANEYAASARQQYARRF